jgi:hypothetical protein
MRLGKLAYAQDLAAFETEARTASGGLSPQWGNDGKPKGK